MIALQVWNGLIIDERYLRCMASVNAICIKKNIQHVIVCRDAQLFSMLDDVKLVNYDEYMVGKDIDWWKNIITKYHQSQADFIRLDYAMKTPDLLYVDADVELFEIPEFAQDNKPYIGTENGWVDFFMMYVNGNTQFFVDLLNDVKKHLYPKSMLVFVDYFNRHYRPGSKNRDKINVFPADCYKRNWFKQ